MRIRSWLTHIMYLIKVVFANCADFVVVVVVVDTVTVAVLSIFMVIWWEAMTTIFFIHSALSIFFIFSFFVHVAWRFLMYWFASTRIV